MKISHPKLASAPKTAERPQLATPKSGNTGSVPTAPSKPEDSFQTRQVKPNGTGSTSGSVSIAIPKGETAPGGTSSATGTSSVATPKTQSTSTYTLPPNLEGHRATFDAAGQRIGKLPSHVQEDAILRESSRLAKDFEGIASPAEVETSVRAAAAYWGRSTTTDDPHAYAAASRVVDTAVDTAKDVSSVKDRVIDYGRSVTRDPSSLNPRNILRNARQPRQEQQEQQPEETRQLFRRMPRWF